MIPKCLKLYNSRVSLLNNPNIPYSGRKRVRKQVLKYSKECAKLGVYNYE